MGSGPRAWSAIGLSFVSGAIFVVASLLPWLELRHPPLVYLFGAPPSPGAAPAPSSVRPHGFPLRGLSTGAGQVVMIAGSVSLVFTAAGALARRVRRLGWLVVVPALVVAGAVGEWHRALGGNTIFGRGWSLAALAGVVTASLAVGLWPAERTPRGRCASICMVLAASTLVCGACTFLGTRGKAVEYLFDRVFGAH